MTDRIPDTSSENCTAALAHLAFCALVAQAFARQDGVAGTPCADNLFLVRWLASAQVSAGTASHAVVTVHP